MGWLAVLHSWLRHVGESSPVYGLQYIALLLCFPVFQAHNFLFKLSYALNQRHLRRLGLQNLLLDHEYRAITGGRVVDLDQTLRVIEQRCKDLERGDSFHGHD